MRPYAANDLSDRQIRLEFAHPFPELVPFPRIERLARRARALRGDGSGKGRNRRADDEGEHGDRLAFRETRQGAVDGQDAEPSSRRTPSSA